MTIKPNELHLWHANDTTIEHSHDAFKYCRRVINTHENNKANRFHFKYDQQLYTVAHGMLRIILSYYDSNVCLEEWAFNKNKYGKWSIANSNPLELTFNLSHTKSGIVILIGCGVDVGVDIENIRTSNLSEETDLLSIASNFFSENEVKGLRVQKREQQKEHFLRLWTLKESYIKAIGKGLSADLMSFSFTFPSPSKLKFIDHVNGLNDLCQNWHYQSNKHSLVSITCLKHDAKEKGIEQIHTFDFSELNGWGHSNECFRLFAES